MAKYVWASPDAVRRLKRFASKKVPCPHQQRAREARRNHDREWSERLASVARSLALVSTLSYDEAIRSVENLANATRLSATSTQELADAVARLQQPPARVQCRCVAGLIDTGKLRSSVRLERQARKPIYRRRIP